MIVRWARLDMDGPVGSIEAIHSTREALPITVTGSGGTATDVTYVNVTPGQITLGFTHGTAIVYTPSTTAVAVEEDHV